MLELQIIKGVNRIYRSVVRLGLRSVNARDKRALRALDASLEHAQDTRDLARKLRQEADVIEDTAHLDYAIKQRQINSAHNVLSNALDDVTLDL